MSQPPLRRIRQCFLWRYGGPSVWDHWDIFESTERFYCSIINSQPFRFRFEEAEQCKYCFQVFYSTSESIVYILPLSNTKSINCGFPKRRNSRRTVHLSGSRPNTNRSAIIISVIEEYPSTWLNLPEWTGLCTKFVQMCHNLKVTEAPTCLRNR